MEIRKLQKTGGSSLTITLPKKWLDRSKLQDKDAVAVHGLDAGYLLLKPSITTQVQKAIFAIDGLDANTLLRELIAYYLSGTDEIVIRSQNINSEQRNWVRNLTNAFIGFEIVDESAKEITLKNIFDDKKFTIPQRIDKMFTITETMFEDSLKALSENNTTLAQDIVGRDFEIDKLHWAIVRQFHSLISFKLFEEEIGITFIDLHYFEMVSTQLERIADHAVKIANAIIETPQENLQSIAKSKNFKMITEKIIAMLHDTAFMVKSLDTNMAHKILDQSKEVELAITVEKRHYAKSNLVEIITEDSFDRIRGYIMNIAEMTIDQSVLQRELQQ